MYEAFFGLREKPFALTPNTEFLVQLAPYQACLNLLRVALGEGEGFIKVTGEVGTGKTLLCRALLNLLDAERYQLAYLPNPCLSPLELRQALARELRIEGVDNLQDHALLDALQIRLIELAAAGKSCVLLIDEAQALPAETLEALRLLTNLETEQRKLLQVVLFGQPELDKRLASYKFRQLRQRVSFSYLLRGMTYYEVQAYVSTRSEIAGVRQPLFSPGALKAIWKYSRGIPRLVNVLSHKGLMLAFGENKLQVDTKHLRYAAKDTEDVQEHKPFINPILLGVLVSVVFILAAAAWHYRELWL